MGLWQHWTLLASNTWNARLAKVLANRHWNDWTRSSQRGFALPNWSCWSSRKRVTRSTTCPTIRHIWRIIFGFEGLIGCYAVLQLLSMQSTNAFWPLEGSIAHFLKSVELVYSGAVGWRGVQVDLTGEPSFPLVGLPLWLHFQLFKRKWERYWDTSY